VLLADAPQGAPQITQGGVPEAERTVPVAFFGALLFAFRGFPRAVFVVPLSQ